MPLEPGTVCESGKHEQRESRTGDQQSHDSPEHPLEPTSAPSEQSSIRDTTKILKSSSNVPPAGSRFAIDLVDASGSFRDRSPSRAGSPLGVGRRRPAGAQADAFLRDGSRW